MGPSTTCATGESCLIFANCVDFDMLWGIATTPRVVGARRLTNAFQSAQDCGPKDVLIILANHGRDPTTTSTDHSREYVPILVTGDGEPENLGIRKPLLAQPRPLQTSSA